MTIICALNDEKENCVWLGSNDRCVLDNIVVPGHDNKWVHLGEWVIGVTGSGPRDEALLSMSKEFSKKSLSVSDAIKLMRQAFSDFELGEDDDGVKRFCGAGIIVSKNGRVWDHDGSIAVTEIPAGEIWVRGSGMEMALGALKAFQQFGLTGEEIVTKTLSVVTDNDLDCPGKPFIQRFDRDGKLSPVFCHETPTVRK